MPATKVNINGINELDLNLSGTVTATTSGGVTTITQTGGSGLELEVNGTPNADQALLNLQSGFGIAVADAGAGGVPISSVTHSESLTDGDANFIFSATLTTGGDIITVVGVPN